MHYELQLEEGINIVELCSYSPCSPHVISLQRVLTLNSILDLHTCKHCVRPVQLAPPAQQVVKIGFHYTIMLLS